MYNVVRERNNDVLWGEVIWRGAQCRRWSFIGWLAIKDRLQTRKRLCKWGSCDTPDCVVCRADEETIEHLWFQCPYVKTVTDIVLQWLGIGFRGVSITEWLNRFVAKAVSRRGSAIYQGKLMGVMVIIYYVWMTKTRSSSITKLVMLRNARGELYKYVNTPYLLNASSKLE